MLKAALPIDDVLPDLISALSHSRTAVLIAPPGAGKTTRVPPALLTAPTVIGKIIVLEPRRLAARAAARRMAAELGEDVGQTVGYRVRMDACVSARTRIEVVTEGIFTRMILADAGLAGVGAVLFDEFHERSLDGDLGLALALDARALRDDLTVLVMSATIDGARVAALMGGAPIIESRGRLFPVETRHVDRDPLATIERQVADAIRDVVRTDSGSVLAFLPGQAEIRRTAEQLAGRLPADIDLDVLHGQLEPAEQDRAIRPAPPGRRKVVLATSIAETSLTIDGVRIVVDSGYRRMPVYEPATGLTTLETRRVSQAAADQRRGRAGRTAPGVCIRLWNERQTAALETFDAPEIVEADLAGFALDLANWGVTDPAQLSFLDPPPRGAFAEAVQLLKRLGALDDAGGITSEGRSLAQLPLHPRLAHMVQEGGLEGDAALASQLAVLISERGLGGDDPDLAQRLTRFRQDRSSRASAARGLAARWATLAGTAIASIEPGDPGRHLARAYPDRIAEAAGGPGRFRLANGRAAALLDPSPLSGSRFLVVAEMTGRADNAVIRAAAAIDRQTIEELFAATILDETRISFDRTSRSVRARRVRSLGAIRLNDEPVPLPDAVAASSVLESALGPDDIDGLPWSREQVGLRGRTTFLHASIGAPFPDLSTRGLAGTTGWLAPFIVGRNAVAAITTSDLEAALTALVPYALRAEVDRNLPSHFVVPTGSRIAIDYAAENGPVLAVRVQELFGLDRHPAVGGGRIPLLLVLLSPAHRPIQTTRDLPGFWRGSWRDVAKDLKGRYPRHPWPDNPLSSAPTRHTKARQAGPQGTP